MEKDALIIVTGAAGFIGSCIVQFLNNHGYENLILVDKFSDSRKENNWKGKKYKELVERENFFDWLHTTNPNTQYVIHMGARSDTTEFDYNVHQELNVDYSKNIWNYCTGNKIPLIYASSAATYGNGEDGYYDSHEIVERLHPLNPYGVSKNEFDKWIMHETSAPPFWAGLKFFNVYGPNEYHKGRMASVVYHAFKQIKKDGTVKLFRSHKAGYKDGEQLRDFIYVKDVLKVIKWMMQQSTQQDVKLKSGLYNVGTGKARSFNDVVKAVFNAMNVPPNIIYIDIPDEIRDKYQYFTEAYIQKLRNAGYEEPFYSLEDGIHDYVTNYLLPGKYF